MMKKLMMSALFAVSLAGLTSCGSTDVHHHHYENADCTVCAAHERSGGWCDSCAVGYRNGHRVACRTCYDANR